jgi:hypothetical protein
MFQFIPDYQGRKGIGRRIYNEARNNKTIWFVKGQMTGMPIGFDEVKHKTITECAIN